MSIWRVNGGKKLQGACFVQGAKNAALPVMAASVLCPARTELFNVPRIADVENTLRILRCLGCEARQEGTDVYIDSGGLSSFSIPREMMEGMRSSVIFLGALLARCGEARISMPGGCNLGARPIDLHLAALEAMGAEISVRDGEIYCRTDGLHGAEIALPLPSVGATENAMLAACAAKGETVIQGAAREPEIEDLQEYLRRLGAGIYGAGTGRIIVSGASGFTPEARAGHRIMPDRIACATILCAAAASGGDVELVGVEPKHFSTVTDLLERAGCAIITKSRSSRIISDGPLHSPGAVFTGPYPGFPTDAQPLLMAALLKAEGTTEFTENIFENRFRHVSAFRSFGADAEAEGARAVVRGVAALHGAEVVSTDLRAGAAMVIAGLSAEGETHILDEGHIVRGYDGLDRTLCALGGDVALTA
jgi:UDP-N-acetylglucosamine 1-carboxyvinyltransferase